MKFSFPSELTSVSLTPVTSATDQIDNVDEVVFKCFNKCPHNTDCSLLTGIVNWYSENGSIFHTNSLRYNSTSRHLYAYLNENLWTNYLNNPVNSKIFRLFML
jgi:hypothetical protein